jgi:hypothetical protein
MVKNTIQHHSTIFNPKQKKGLRGFAPASGAQGQSSTQTWSPKHGELVTCFWLEFGLFKQNGDVTGLTGFIFQWMNQYEGFNQGFNGVL